MRNIKSGSIINLNLKSMKKSVVTKTEYEKEWMPPSGDSLLHFHWVEMENGDKGSYCSKSKDQEKFVVGVEVEYEFTPGAGDSHGKIKPHYQKSDSDFKGGASSVDEAKRQEIISRQNVLNRATEICIHNANVRPAGAQGEPSDCSVSVDQVLNVAGTLAIWVTDNGRLL